MPCPLEYFILCCLQNFVFFEKAKSENPEKGKDMNVKQENQVRNYHKQYLCNAFDLWDERLFNGIVSQNYSTQIIKSKRWIENMTIISSTAGALIRRQTPVLIVGGGPCGMLTSLLLSKYNVPSILIEKGKHQPMSHPRAHVLNARSMEILRKVSVCTHTSICE